MNIVCVSGSMRYLLVPIVMFATLSIAGCSGASSTRAAVSGSVRIDGEPLEEGSIAFFPAAGSDGPSAGGVVTNGHYDIPRNKGATLGSNRVQIRGFRRSGKQIRDIWNKQMVDEKVPAVPAEYNDRSKLICDIVSGQNQIDFDLHRSQAQAAEHP